LSLVCSTSRALAFGGVVRGAVIRRATFLNPIQRVSFFLYLARRGLVDQFANCRRARFTGGYSPSPACSFRKVPAMFHDVPKAGGPNRSLHQVFSVFLLCSSLNVFPPPSSSSSPVESSRNTYHIFLQVHQETLTANSGKPGFSRSGPNGVRTRKWSLSGLKWRCSRPAGVSSPFQSRGGTFSSSLFLT